MGLFVYLSGRFRCIRCRVEVDASFQTKLIRAEVDNCSREYRVGDSERIDGLDDFNPLEPWDGHGPLVVAIGDWDCPRCSLTWHWARLVLAVNNRGSEGMLGTIEELSVLIPSRDEDLRGVHFIVDELAALKGM